MTLFTQFSDRFPLAKKCLVFFLMALGCATIACHYFLPTHAVVSGPPGTDSPPDAPPPTSFRPAPARGIPVTVIRVEPSAYPAKIKAFGQAQALWQTTLRSQVSGRIDHISDAFRKGRIVRQGALLVRINDSRYRASLARADQALSSARLELLREKQEAGQARINWDASGLPGRPGSPLVLREPQMNLAQKTLATARAAYESAAVDLGDCRITAPFPGVITDRLVSPGDTVSPGDRIAVISGTDRMEISLSLDADQRRLLGKNLTNARVILTDEAAGVSHETGTLRGSHTIDPETRLQKFFCLVENPTTLAPPLLPGTFLTVHISGRSIPDTIKLPVSALTRRGLVWAVTPQNTLTPVAASALFYNGSHVFISAPADGVFPMQVVQTPNSAFVEGMKVRPVPATTGKGV
ncbi:MAG: efflux RND transporter periplasmic adaptor subunit [Desulfobacter sp.]